MKKLLEDLKWRPMWASHVGCIKGCLDFLGGDAPDAWVYGATGHAFIMNVHETVCPSGPTMWRTAPLMDLCRNIGCSIEGVIAGNEETDFNEKQRAAWEMVNSAIDGGMPCYGWDMKVPEYYVVKGYDEDGYYYSGAMCDGVEGPKPWEELGTGDIGWMEIYGVKPCQCADDIKTVKDALEFAVTFAEGPEKWLYPMYKAGPKAYDNWINAIESGTAHEFGTPYNSAVWNECRKYAVKFLEHAKDRVGGHITDLFDEAIEHYRTVSENLRQVAELFPFPPKGREVYDAGICAAAVECLKTAREAEIEALESLKKIHDAV